MMEKCKSQCKTVAKLCNLKAAICWWSAAAL